MRIITGADNEYKKFYDRLKADAVKFGYEFSGYDYGGLGEGTPMNVGLKNPTDYSVYVGKIPGKPLVILDALERYDDFLVYLDSDVRIKHPIDEIIGDYDIGITSHDPSFHEGEERYLWITGYLNAGVIFINNTQAAKQFILEWMKDIEESSARSDQEALTNLLRRYIDDWTKENHMVMGARVRLFPSAIYNYTGIRGECSDPKIRHFTGTIADKIKAGAFY